MNIDSILPPSTPLLKNTETAQNISTTESFSPEISKRLDVLSLLSSKVLASMDSKFSAVIEKLNQPHIDYKKCKLLFVEAYIQDFNEIERDFFLTHFLDHFDPSREIVRLELLDFETKDYFWQNIISYLCESYMDFPAHHPLTLLNTFTSHFTKEERGAFEETEECLERRFDNGMDLLLDFSPHSTHPTEIKILFATYLARLISKLEELQSPVEDPTHPKESLESYFEELYFYLLSMPCPSQIEGQSTPLMSLMKEDLKLLDGEALRKSFITHLIDFLSPVSASSEKREALREVLGQVHFLDFQV